MLEGIVELVTPIIISILELMGILIIIVGAIKAFYKFALGILTKKSFPIKVEFAQSLTLALEFKLGAEILKTVIVRSLEEMYILAAIIILRAILAFVIHWEMKE
ncbi:DUF1622 domain-containing protein [Clostridium isatidis]|uniref:DUF1622 domain-containing protein n=1 Tax=Clostridium isatidis TaxID=182773 RepID=A0A343J8X7_9CLOT|nr:DUF1622 domain-containing protein [Clostridium isatidis]ASW41985.1 hypothetical protein BEN51_00205 [Clostridium isatidis]NLZ33984.1 DUF1622 domain-containing protein [Clostridiales bacterium]